MVLGTVSSLLMNSSFNVNLFLCWLFCLPEAGISWPSVDEVFPKAEQHQPKLPKRPDVPDGLSFDSLLNSVSGLYTVTRTPARPRLLTYSLVVKVFHTSGG